MTETSETYLTTFPRWLESLGTDAATLASAVEADGVSAPAREWLAGGLSYLFKTLDLIPDGVDDIGYLDDAFILRLTADWARKEGVGPLSGAARDAIDRLADETSIVQRFLGSNAERLERYARNLRKTKVRGRQVADIATDAAVRSEFAGDVRRFGASYEPPSFAREEKTLAKLRAFFDAKLPK